MPKTVYTNDFKTIVFDIIKHYDGSPCNLMISGGSLLDVLNDPSYANLDSSKWSIYYADERVDPKGSNYTGSLPFLKMLKSNVSRMQVEKKECAKEYSNILPMIDVCLLGIGPDGHICSLFPGTPDSNEKVISITNPNVQYPERVTTTLTFLNNQVKDLYFIVPDKNGEVKKITEPHESILSRLTKDYTTVLHSSLQ